jgi:hypothetical protein
MQPCARVATTTATNMKTITITVDVDGNSVDRSYAFSATPDWGACVEDMLDTLKKSPALKVL